MLSETRTAKNRIFIQTIKDILSVRRNSYSEEEKLFQHGLFELVDLYDDYNLAYLSDHVRSKHKKEKESVKALFLQEEDIKSLSIIIPVQGRRLILFECIESILRQDFLKHHPDKVQVIIIQDGYAENSSDDPICDELYNKINLFSGATKFKLFRLKENKGRSTARNIGIYYADNEVVFFIDSSMILNQDFLTEHMVRHQRVPNIALLGFKENLFWDDYLKDIDLIKNGNKTPNYRNDIKYNHILTEDEGGFFYKNREYKATDNICYMELTNWLRDIDATIRIGNRTLNTYFQTNIASVDLNTVKEVGGFDPAFDTMWGFEDSFLGALLLTKGVKLIPCPSSLSFKIEHPDNTTKEFDKDRQRDNYTERLEKEAVSRYNKELLGSRINRLQSLDLVEEIRLGVTAEISSSPGTVPIRELTCLQDIDHYAKRTRNTLKPQILPCIKRFPLVDKYLGAIRQSVNESSQRVIPIIGGAGYGKSTILGLVYDELDKSGDLWVALAGCGALSIDGAANYHSLSIAFGEAIQGTKRSIVEIAAELTKNYGKGVVLIDTLDLILNNLMVPELAHLLNSLLENNVTVVFTCRDFEYRAFIEPPREKLIGVYIDRYEIKEFDSDEVKEAARAFIERNPNMTPPGGAEFFAQSIIELSTDDRVLHGITHNPLLLAMLCDLFAQEGCVPHDLTVSKLYNRYWEDKIKNSRKYGLTSPITIHKSLYCYSLARTLFDMSFSADKLFISAHETDLHISINKEVFDARGDLLSDGVLRTLPIGRIEFFHQTMAEYVIACWLTTHAGKDSKNHLLEALRDSGKVDFLLYWLPVVRQFMSLVEHDEFKKVMNWLDLSKLPIFRTIAYASVSRNELFVLRDLLSYALQMGEEFQETFVEVIESTPVTMCEFAWEALVELLCHSKTRIATNAANAAGTLFAVRKSIPGHSFAESIEAIRQRGSKGIVDDASSLLGQLIAHLAAVGRPLSAETLSTLQMNYQTFNNSVKATIVKIHNINGTSVGARRSLLQILVSLPVSVTLKEEATHLLRSLLNYLVESGGSCFGSSLHEALHARLPKGWDIVQFKAIGSLLVDDTKMLEIMTNSILTGKAKDIDRNLNAVRVAIGEGGYETVSSCLFATPVGLVHYENLNAVSLLIEDVAVISQEMHEKLINWLRPVLHNYPEKLINSLGVLAGNSLSAKDLFIQVVKQNPNLLTPEQIVKVLRVASKAILEDMASELEPLLLSRKDTRSETALVILYSALSESMEEYIPKLIKMCLVANRSVALKASEFLLNIASKSGRPTPDDLILLLDSNIPGVRIKSLDSLIKMIQTRKQITLKFLVKLCSRFNRIGDEQLLQRLTELIIEWVRLHKSAPGDLTEELCQVAQSALERGVLRGAAARGFIRALKALAQESQGKAPEIREPALGLLKSVDLNKVKDGESEMIDLLSAISRTDETFLLLLAKDSTNLPSRNVRAIASTIKRVEGPSSPLLKELLRIHPNHSQLKKLIYKFWGI